MKINFCKLMLAMLAVFPSLGLSAAESERYSQLLEAEITRSTTTLEHDWPGLVFAQEDTPIGGIYSTHLMHADSKDTRGMAFDESDPANPRLYVLDAGKYVVVYAWTASAKTLTKLEKITLAKISNVAPVSPRGLAVNYENSKRYLYFLEWDATSAKGYLWKQDVSAGTAEKVDLSLSGFDTKGRELSSCTIASNRIYITFDTSGATDNHEKTRLGMISFQVAGSVRTSVTSTSQTRAHIYTPLTVTSAWSQVKAGMPYGFRTMPISGAGASRGLAFMDFDGTQYLWGSVTSNYIYLADEASGRGIFYFPVPKPGKAGQTFWGLAYGAGVLWAAERLSGTDQVHRVNVRENLYEPYAGAKQLRRLVMKLTTSSAASLSANTYVYHYYSRPYANAQAPNQGRWPTTETLDNLTLGRSPVMSTIEDNPGDDPGNRQFLKLAKYPAVAGSFSSQYEIDMWSREHRYRVYPHLATTDTTALGSADYLSDDSTLYNLDDTTAYDGFIARVESYINDEYSGGARMTNPYWLARNVVEYMLQNYYYPDDNGHPATVDYDNAHYNANPANLKLKLSAGRHNGDEIVPCSPASVMVAGALRYKGVPARWIGTGAEEGFLSWDPNLNGLLEEGEQSTVTNGHRFAQVWLGTNYGWQKFDGTPFTPPDGNYEVLPPKVTQFGIMDRAAALMEAGRVIFNIQSHKYTPMFKEYEDTPGCAENSSCGGDQRYNLQGRFDRPTQWNSPGYSIRMENLLFVKNVTLTRSGFNSVSRSVGSIATIATIATIDVGVAIYPAVSWSFAGKWDEDPDATIAVELVQKQTDGTYATISTLKSGLSTEATSVHVDLNSFVAGSGYAIRVVKTGDSRTGGITSEFSLPF